MLIFKKYQFYFSARDPETYLYVFARIRWSLEWMRISFQKWIKRLFFIETPQFDLCIALINVGSLRRVEPIALITAIWLVKAFHDGLFIEGASYVAFMWPSKAVTWPELATSVDTYIWAVCSFKRKSHAMNMNIWLYRQSSKARKEKKCNTDKNHKNIESELKKNYSMLYDVWK